MFHIGTARTAYLNWLAARSTGGRFTLRIDDTDLTRSKDQYTQVILDGLDWMGLDYDRLYFQSERLDLYNGVIQMLIDGGWTVPSDDGVKMVMLQVPDYLIPDRWTDSIGGTILVSDADKRAIANGIVIRKTDGMPTYNFCSIVDDMDLCINWVIRGVDHISNTPKQIAIANCIKIQQMTQSIPQWSHVGLIFKDKKKISKRDGAASVLDYKDKYDSLAFLNFIMKLGWTGTIDAFDSKYPLIDKKLAVTLFMDGKMKASPANFDQAKLDWYNKKWKSQ